MTIIVCMLSLASVCIAEGLTGQKILSDNIRHLLPVPIFVVVTFFHVAGITRNLWILVQQILSSFALQLHLRVFSVTLSWLVIFGITKILPQLLYQIGVGYLYAYSVILMIVIVGMLNKVIPSELNLENNEPSPIINSLTASSCEHTPSTSQNSSCDEIRNF
jgi:hypothetical protein